MSQWIIIYPQGDRSRLSVAEISDGMEYEKNDYALASRNDYPTEAEAIERGRELAKKNGLKFTAPHGSHDYLD